MVDTDRREAEVLAVRPLADAVEIDLHVPPDLFWFRGHFPGVPILPGVVQIDWAIAMACRHFAADLSAGRALRVKFRSVIQPDERVTLALRHVTGKKAVAFEYRRDGEVCSSGQVGAEP